MKKSFFILLVVSVFFCTTNVYAQPQKNFRVIAYYNGNVEDLDKYPVEKLTHIIYSFTHLKDRRLTIDETYGDTLIKKMVSLKLRNPKLRILLSLGGWGGCEPCSEAFATADGRTLFAQSVKELLLKYHADGIDMDWEYPAIAGYPGHKFGAEDKQNFTALILELRKTLGNKTEISFAAGGFDYYLLHSIEWEKVCRLVDFINIMSYDLANGMSNKTGHHTALYSTTFQKESTDNAVRFLDSIGVPSGKIVIGAAFYARTWEKVDSINHGLYQNGKFKDFVTAKKFASYFSKSDGYIDYWDSTANAPYSYSPTKKMFGTYDNTRSIELKTKYALNKKLGGIMFWELSGDVYNNGNVDAIDRVLKQSY
jgi:Chitinase